ncbi:MAG: TIR domain-containing protein [Saprospiraceae bacterium]
MVSTKNLFISHSWAYSDAYEKLVALLDDAPYFYYRNYSVPQNDPIHNAKNDSQLYDAIKAQIAPSSVVVILAGVYSSYSKWIDKEIYIAKNEFYNPKPIIAIEPWASEKTSVLVKNSADKIVKWQTSSIIEAIRELTK